MSKKNQRKLQGLNFYGLGTQQKLWFSHPVSASKASTTALEISLEFWFSHPVSWRISSTASMTSSRDFPFNGFTTCHGTKIGCQNHNKPPRTPRTSCTFKVKDVLEDVLGSRGGAVLILNWRTLGGFTMIFWIMVLRSNVLQDVPVGRKSGDRKLCMHRTGNVGKAPGLLYF